VHARRDQIAFRIRRDQLGQVHGPQDGRVHGFWREIGDRGLAAQEQQQSGAGCRHKPMCSCASGHACACGHQKLQSEWIRYFAVCLRTWQLPP
jgi:hypothetical protein